MIGGSAHEVTWVAAGIRRAAAEAGVELPAGYARDVAAQALARGEEVGVTGLGRGVVLSALPGESPGMVLVVGYADAGGQWYRDGRRHRDSEGTAPAKETAVAVPGALVV